MCIEHPKNLLKLIEITNMNLARPGDIWFMYNDQVCYYILAMNTYKLKLKIKFTVPPEIRKYVGINLAKYV